MIKLNLGSGHRKFSGLVSVDDNPSCSPDVLHDLTQYPWPFEDDSADEIVCIQVLEHLVHQGNVKEFFSFFRECWRILKNGKSLLVEVPDANSGQAFSDPGHKSAWNKNIFAFISKQNIVYNAERGTSMTAVELDFDFGITVLDVVDGNIIMKAVAIK